jgi:hypothetical protein
MNDNQGRGVEAFLLDSFEDGQGSLCFAGMAGDSQAGL